MTSVAGREMQRNARVRARPQISPDLTAPLPARRFFRKVQGWTVGEEDDDELRAEPNRAHVGTAGDEAACRDMRLCLFLIGFAGMAAIARRRAQVRTRRRFAAGTRVQQNATFAVAPLAGAAQRCRRSRSGYDFVAMPLRRRGRLAIQAVTERFAKQLVEPAGLGHVPQRCGHRALRDRPLETTGNERLACELRFVREERLWSWQ